MELSEEINRVTEREVLKEICKARKNACIAPLYKGEGDKNEHTRMCFFSKLGKVCEIKERVIKQTELRMREEQGEFRKRR